MKSASSGLLNSIALLYPAHFGFLFLLFALLFLPEKERSWCYEEVLVPAEYGTVKKKVLKTGHGMGGQPAQYKMVDEQVLIKKASTEYLPIICEKDLSTFRLKKVVKSLKKKGVEASKEKTTSRNEILALLINYLTKHRLAKGYFTKESMDHLGVDFPRLYKKYGAVLCHEPSVYPSDYETVSEQVTANGETTTVTKQVLKKITNPHWEPCLCDPLLTKEMVSDIYKILQEREYLFSRPNNIDDMHLVLRALAKFQLDNDLPMGGFNHKTLDALGVMY